MRYFYIVDEDNDEVGTVAAGDIAEALDIVEAGGAVVQWNDADTIGVETGTFESDR